MSFTLEHNEQQGHQIGASRTGFPLSGATASLCVAYNVQLRVSRRLLHDRVCRWLVPGTYNPGGLEGFAGREPCRSSSVVSCGRRPLPVKGVGQMYRKRAQVLLDRTAEVSDERTAEASPGVVRIGLQVSLLRGRAGNG